jgi:hypothetical protein
MAVRAINVNLGAGDILLNRRTQSGVAVVADTMTAVASPAPTTTSFGVLIAGSTAEVGDILGLAAATPTYLAPETTTMPRVTDKQISGANNIYTVSPAFSGAPPTTAGGVRILWRDCGATDGGIQLESTLEIEPVFVDQALDPIAPLLKSRETMIKAPLAENSLVNVAAGFGVATSSVAGVLQIGGTVGIREDRCLLITPAPSGLKRYTVAHRAVNEGTTTIRAAKDGKSMVELNLRVYLDTTQPTALQLLDMREA